MLAHELRRLQRQDGVRRERATSTEVEAEALASRFQRRLRGVRRLRRARSALRRDGGVEEERREVELDLPVAVQTLDLDEADIAPRSDRV